MKTFKIAVNEILSRVVRIEAETKEDAIQIVSQEYNNQRIVLDWSDFVDVKIVEEIE